MQLNDLSKRCANLLVKSAALLTTKKSIQYMGERVDEGDLAGLRASCLSFINMAYGISHSHYAEFDDATNNNFFVNAQKAHAILKSIQEEIDGDWIFSIKHLASAEIFSDFLEMAEYLLAQNYKDPAAVMIGSVLEENLRQICTANSIDITYEKDGVHIPKRADRLNTDLAKLDSYSKLDQKAVTMWLDIRNKAAHGHYKEYTQEQVVLMLQGVTDFLSRKNS